MVVNKTKKPIGASSIYKLNLKKKKKSNSYRWDPNFLFLESWIGY